MKDLTRNFEYARLVEEEKEHYARIELTEDLKEGGRHASSAWRYYWQRVEDVIARTEFADMASYLSRTLASLDRPIEIVSLGSGYCGNELALARRISRPYRLKCTDINGKLFERARAVAQSEGLCVEFEEADLNFLRLEPNRYDLVFAHASIHHVINLEHVFDEIVQGLTPQGVFHLIEVVGKNRTLIWGDNERLVEGLLKAIPIAVTAGLGVHSTVAPATALGKAKGLIRKVIWTMRRLRWEPGGMEGIRQAEIVPLLNERFEPLFECRHGAFMRFICTNPALSQRFSPDDRRARPYLDFLIDADAAAVRRGIAQPLEIWGVYRPVRKAAG